MPATGFKRVGTVATNTGTTKPVLKGSVAHKQESMSSEKDIATRALS